MSKCTLLNLKKKLVDTNELEHNYYCYYCKNVAGEYKLQNEIGEKRLYNTGSPVVLWSPRGEGWGEGQ